MAHEVAFIDPSIPELDAFLAGLRPEVEAILLSPKFSAPAQISEKLTDRADLDAIHIVAHGAPGVVSFSSGALTLETLKEHETHVAKIGDALAPHGELLLWSCLTGKGARGAAFIDALERAAGTSVAATGNLVGSTEKGGSWALEAGQGVFREMPLSKEAARNYTGLMLTLDLDSGAEGVDRTTTYFENQDNIFVFGDAVVEADVANWITELEVTLVTPLSGTVSLSNPTFTGLIPEFTNNGIKITGLPLTETSVWQNALNDIIYNDISNDNPTGPIIADIKITQAFAGIIPTATAVARVTINIIPTDDPAFVVVPPSWLDGPDQLAEDTSLTYTGLQVGDADSDFVQVSLSSFGGALSLSGVAGLTFIVGDGSSDFQMRFFGTKDAINAALSSVTYVPPLNFNGLGSIFVDVNGGPLSGGHNAVQSIFVTAVNDTPFFVLPPSWMDAESTQLAEDTSLTVTGIQVGDVDGIRDVFGDVILDPLTMTLSAFQGALSLSGVAGLTFTQGDGSSDAVMVFSGSQDAINAALSSLTFVPTLNHNGTSTINLLVTDGTGPYGVTEGIAVTAVNDPAVIGGQVTGSVTEDAILAVGGTLTITDVDAGEASFTAGTFAGSFGSLDLTQTGEWTYTLANANSTVQALGSGQSSPDTIAVTSVDGTVKQITITINGANESGGAGQTVDGTSGDDQIPGGNGNDVVNAGGGNDTVLTGNGSDLVQAGSGNDTVHGGNGSDTLYGDAGDDVLFGEQGTDTLHGGAGNDEVNGGQGGDILFGDTGNDTLIGDVGNDRFVFAPGFGSDTISDFDFNPAGGGQDLLDISAFGITSATFASRVGLTDLGADIRVTIDGDANQTITLQNVQLVSTINQSDFILS